VIPPAIPSVVCDAMYNLFRVRLGDCDSYLELDRLLQLRMEGIAIGFRRILKFESNLAETQKFHSVIVVICCSGGLY
jgi:hypothetical protein